MKKIKQLLFALLMSLSLYSCGGGSSPKGVAQDFMTALAKQDFDAAKELGTDKTKGFLSMVQGLMQMMPEEKKKETFGNTDSIEWGETKVDGDKATVYFNSKDGKKDKINLVKVDGEWKVDMKKDL